MALDTAATCDLCDLFQESSMRRQLALAEVCAIATPTLSTVYLPLSDCTCGRLKPHSPSCGHRHDFEESHGRLRLLVLNSKHNVHHREQRLHDEIMALSDDMEFEQIY
jgi:hypothetical protein